MWKEYKIVEGKLNSKTQKDNKLNENFRLKWPHAKAKSIWYHCLPQNLLIFLSFNDKTKFSIWKLKS